MIIIGNKVVSDFSHEQRMMEYEGHVEQVDPMDPFVATAKPSGKGAMRQNFSKRMMIMTMNWSMRRHQSIDTHLTGCVLLSDHCFSSYLYFPSLSTLLNSDHKNKDCPKRRRNQHCFQISCNPDSLFCEEPSQPDKCNLSIRKKWLRQDKCRCPHPHPPRHRKLHYSFGSWKWLLVKRSQAKLLRKLQKLSKDQDKYHNLLLMWHTPLPKFQAFQLSRFNMRPLKTWDLIDK